MMSIYLTGCIISAILCLTVHVIEYFEGIPKHLGETLVISVLVIAGSWLMVVFFGCNILGYIIDKLQGITIVRKK